MSSLDCFGGKGLAYNIAKLKTMTCHPGATMSRMLEEALGWRSTEEVSTYRERLRIKDL